MTLPQSARHPSSRDGLLKYSPRRALDRLYHDCSNPLTISLESFSNVVDVTKAYFSASMRERADLWHERAVHWRQPSDTLLSALEGSSKFHQTHVGSSGARSS